jgi:hypothetical protein
MPSAVDRSPKCTVKSVSVGRRHDGEQTHVEQRWVERHALVSVAMPRSRNRCTNLFVLKGWPHKPSWPRT